MAPRFMTRALALAFLLLASGLVSRPLEAQDGWNFRSARRLVERPVRVDTLLPGPRPNPGYRSFFSGPLAAVVAETEPNDTVTTAPLFMLGDTISGAIDPPGDFDYFRFNLDSGEVVVADLASLSLGSLLSPEIALLLMRRDTNSVGEDSISVFLLDLNSRSDDFDPRIIAQAPEQGEYVVGVRDTVSQGGPGHNYVLRLVPDSTADNEPADDVYTGANDVSIGDRVLGFLNKAADRDFYQLDIPANTLIEVDLDALDVGSPAYAVARLYAADGATVLASTSSPFDPRLKFYAETSRTVYIEVLDVDLIGSPAFYYFMEISTLPVGPGDPPTLYADGIGNMSGMAAADNGDIYYIDLSPSGSLKRLIRVSPDGSSSVVSDTIRSGRGVAIDGFGDILIPGFFAGDGKVWRIDGSGNVTTFAEGVGIPSGAITIGPDGGVWVFNTVSEYLIKFDPFGARVDSVDASALPLPILDLAFSPDGVLHFTASTDKVYRVVNDAIEIALVADVTILSIAFDRDGFLYVANGLKQEVALYSPTYQVVHNPFIRARLGAPVSMIFGRNTDGSMSSRLILANAAFGLPEPFGSSLIEANPAGVRGPGFRVGVDLLQFAAIVPDTARVGEDYLLELSVIGDPTGVVYELVSGSLPPGLELDANDGLIEGAPQEEGEYDFRLRAEVGTSFGELDLRIVVGSPVVSASTIIDGLLGVPGVLTPALEEFLDIQGNQNGIFDVGDARAYLVATGAIATAPPALRALIAEGEADDK